MKQSVIDRMRAVLTCRMLITRGAHTLPHHLHCTLRPLLSCLVATFFCTTLLTASCFGVSTGRPHVSWSGGDVTEVVFVHFIGDVGSYSCNAVHAWHANMKRVCICSSLPNILTAITASTLLHEAHTILLVCTSIRSFVHFCRIFTVPLQMHMRQKYLQQ